MPKKSSETEVVQKPEVKEVVVPNPSWIYGEVQPSQVQTGEAYVHVCNPHANYLNVRTWCEVRVKKADDAYKKVILTDREGAIRIAYTLNKTNGIVKKVLVL